MVTRHDKEIVYQSHLYKIRVMSKAPFDNYLLLAILSSAPVQAQIRSMSFTQDIIDTLGDRINDVVLPVPRSVSLRRRISDTVRRAIEERIDARELIRQARSDVAKVSDEALTTHQGNGGFPI